MSGVDRMRFMAPVAEFVVVVAGILPPGPEISKEEAAKSTPTSEAINPWADANSPLRLFGGGWIIWTNGPFEEKKISLVVELEFPARSVASTVIELSPRRRGTSSTAYEPFEVVVFERKPFTSIESIAFSSAVPAMRIVEFMTVSLIGESIVGASME